MFSKIFGNVSKESIKRMKTCRRFTIKKGCRCTLPIKYTLRIFLLTN